MQGFTLEFGAECSLRPFMSPSPSLDRIRPTSFGRTSYHHNINSTPLSSVHYHNYPHNKTSVALIATRIHNSCARSSQKPPMTISWEPREVSWCQDNRETFSKEQKF